jgi:putative ABC transport system permease protein
MNDLRYAWRSLLKRPGFALLAVGTLSLGVGASTAIFSVVDAVLLRSLPYPSPDRLVEVTELNETGRGMPFAQPNFDDLAARNHSFEALAAYTRSSEAVAGGSEPVRTNVSGVSAEFFRVLGVVPVVGRTFTAEKNPVAVVSYGFWKRMLGGRTNLEGSAVRFANRSFSVIGVLPPKTEFPSGIDVWFPSSVVYPYYESRTAHNFRVIGRLRVGVSFQQANVEVASIGRALKIEHGSQTDAASFGLLNFRERFVRDIRSVLFVLCAAVGLLLAISCSNVANLLLVRATARRKEVALCAALGASRARLARQFIAEALLTAFVAGGFGTLLASWSLRLIVGVYHSDLPRVGEIGINANAFLFTFAISLGTALVLGLVPVFHASGRELQFDLKEVGRGSGGASQSRAGNLLVAAQIALTVMLLVGAGLLGRSFQRLLAIDPGFDIEHTLAMTVLLPQPETPDALRRLAEFNHHLIERIEALPGVTSAGGTSALPMSGNGANGTFVEERSGTAPETLQQLIRQMDALAPNERMRDADYRATSAGYFAAMRIPLIRGRLFQGSDGPDSPHVAVVSQSLVRRYWPNEEPIGKQIEYGNMDGDFRLLTVVGVVGDVRDNGLDHDARPTVYTNYFQRPASTSEFSIVVRARVDEKALTEGMRHEARALNPDAPVQFQTLEQVVSTSFDNRRFSMMMLGIFAAAALVLATVGLYGLLSYMTSQRTTEIGIRMALGAQRVDMLRLILRKGLVLLAGGLVTGAFLSLCSTWLLRSFLFGIGSTDLITYAIVVLLLGITAAIAIYFPARRAMAIDPMIALRDE